jgi:hypothetical protein
VFLAPTTIGDVFGFMAVVLGGASAFFMMLRGRLVKITKNLLAIRVVHVAISAAAGIFLILHIAYFYTYPLTTGVLIGYGAFALGVVVWMTGTAFLEKVRDSLLFHSSFSVVFISLALIHGASANANIEPIISELLIAATLVVIIANALYQLDKMRGTKSPSPKPQSRPKVQNPVGQT